MAEDPSAKRVDRIIKKKVKVKVKVRVQAEVKVQGILQTLDCRSQIEGVLKIQSEILNLKSKIRLGSRIDV
jgi:hypothetical protein